MKGQTQVACLCGFEIKSMKSKKLKKEEGSRDVVHGIWFSPTILGIEKLKT